MINRAFTFQGSDRLNLKGCLLIFAFFFSFSAFSQIEIDSIHYIDVEPLEIYKRGKQKTPKYYYLFHMMANTVHPYEIASNQKPFTILEKSFDGNCIIVLACKDNLFKTKYTFSIPVKEGYDFVITKKKKDYLVSSKYNIEIKEQTKVVL